MGNASSNDAKNTYYTNHVEQIVNNYPVITMIGSWKLWSGRMVQTEVNGVNHAYPVDYTIESKFNDIEGITIVMKALWPPGYPMTRLRASCLTFMTNAWLDYFPSKNSVHVKILMNAASISPSLALPEEKEALGGLVSESLCILLRMIQQAQPLKAQTMVYIEAAGTVRNEHANIDNTPHETQLDRTFAFRDFPDFDLAKYDVADQLSMITVLQSTKSVVKIYERMGFRIRDGYEPHYNYVYMSSTLEKLVHRCRQMHLSNDNSLETGDVHYKQHIAAIINRVRNTDMAGRWKFYSGRYISIYTNTSKLMYPIKYVLEIIREERETGIFLVALWPLQYPSSRLKEQHDEYMATINITIADGEISIDLLYNAASAWPRHATPGEKKALSGLVSEGLCMLLNIIQNSHNIRLHTKVVIEAAGGLGPEYVSIDHIPHATRTQMKNALRRYPRFRGENITDRDLLDNIRMMVRTENVEAIYKRMGFVAIDGRENPSSIYMESTLGTLLENCEHAIVEDNEYS